MRRHLVTPGELLDLHYRGIHSLEIPRDALVTPGAKDLLICLGFKLTWAGEGGQETPSAGPDGDTEDELAQRVRSVVRSLMAEAAITQQEQVVAAVLAELRSRRGGNRL